MPTYDYRCQSCGHTFERFESIKAQPLAECPTCQGPVKRLIGAGGGFLFKGSGFYITDYRSSGYQSAAKADGAAAAPTSGGCGKPECGQGSCASGSGSSSSSGSSSTGSGSGAAKSTSAA